MELLSETEEVETGVYYDRNDYAGFFARMLILAIDTVVVLVLSAAAVVAYVYAKYPAPPDDRSIFLVVAIVWYAYMAGLKATRFGTLGYKLTGYRLVNLKGETPSLARTSARLMFLIVGPLHPILDLIWLGGERDRQTLRDKWAATYVVRKDARPAGAGPIEFDRMFLFAWSILVRTVGRGKRK